MAIRLRLSNICLCDSWRQTAVGRIVEDSEAKPAQDSMGLRDSRHRCMTERLTPSTPGRRLALLQCAHAPAPDRVALCPRARWRIRCPALHHSHSTDRPARPSPSEAVGPDSESSEMTIHSYPAKRYLGRTDITYIRTLQGWLSRYHRQRRRAFPRHQLAVIYECVCLRI